MVKHTVPTRIRTQHGFTLIELLVTLLVMAFGLLGMAGLHARYQMTEFESYQRSQALLLLNDMAQRIATNRAAADAYVTSAATALGASMTCPTASTTVAQRDLAEWCNALQGAAETDSGSGTLRRISAMVGGRGCVEKIGTDYMVTVVWQGLTPITAPASSVACGQDAYNTADTPCTNDRCRRAITTVVRIATLL